MDILASGEVCSGELFGRASEKRIYEENKNG
jgi:hypothetical protein